MNTFMFKKISRLIFDLILPFFLIDPLESPLDVGVDLINSTAIKVTWAPVNKESVRGLLQGYKVTSCVSSL